MFDFAKEKAIYYEDNILPNINPDTGYRLHKTILYSGDITAYHYHGYYEFFLSLKGNAIHHINNSQQTIKQGMLVFIRPSDKHCFEIIGKDSSYEFINFAFSQSHTRAAMSYFEGIYDITELFQNDISPIVPLVPHDISRLTKRFDNANTIPYDDFTEQQLFARRLLCDIIPNFFGNKSNRMFEDIPYWLLRTCNEMKKPENFIAGISKMVELSGKTPEHLSRTLKKFYNTTPTQYINTLKLNYAVNLLTNTNMKTIDVCFESGFINLSTFYSIFKEVHGVTPKEYRKKFFIQQNQP